MKRTASLVVVSSIALGCGTAGEPGPTGFEEPFRASYVPQGQTKPVPAQFFRGELVEDTGGPETRNRTTPSRVVLPGETGHKLSGNPVTTAASVAFRFDDIGTGFWVVPTTIFDVENPGTIKFDALLDFSRDVPPGQHTLKIVAIDSHDRHGPRNELPLIFQSPIPNGAAVATLVWDSNADVDLQIVLPDGTQVDRKHPRSADPIDAGVDAPGTAVFDHDSNANCVSDGWRRESFIWNTLPPPNQTYLAKADLFAACGEPATNFVFTLYVGGQVKSSQAGRFIAQDADNGKPGLAIANFNF